MFVVDTNVIVELFDDGSRRAQRIFAATLLILGVGLGALTVFVPDDDLSGAGRLWVSILLVAGFVAASWMFGRMRLELQIDNRGFTARVRPFRRVRVDAQAVVHAELVEVQPFSEFGGWRDKGLRSNRLLGGGRGWGSLRPIFPAFQDASRLTWNGGAFNSRRIAIPELAL